MKGRHEGNYNLYIDDRDKEFLRAYRKATEELLKTNGRFRLHEALDKARSSATSRYFVSENRAYNVLRSIDLYYEELARCRQKGENPPPFPLSSFTYQRQRMYFHMYNDFNQLRKDNPGIPVMTLVVMTCALPAREFYMNLNSASSILGRIHANMKKFGIMTSREPRKTLRDMNRRR